MTNETNQNQNLTFLLNNQRYPFPKITIEQAWNWKAEGIMNLLNIFSSDGMEFNRIAQNVETSDEFVIDRMWEVVKETYGNDDYEGFIKQLDRPTIETAREAFWNTIVNFPPPSLRPAMQTIKEEVKKNLKTAIQDSIRESTNQSSNSGSENSQERLE